MSQIITAEKFAAALQAAGVLDSTQRVRRVVIDAQAGHMLMIHVEYFGDERVLSVVPTLDGAEITQAQVRAGA
jgi:hypothetical protein